MRNRTEQGVVDFGLDLGCGRQLLQSLKVKLALTLFIDSLKL